MNYCYNCGAKIIEHDQKFCIKCGINLQQHDEKYKSYKKESRRKYNQLEGENYNEYLNRINSPLKDVDSASMEEIEAESISYTTKAEDEEMDYYPIEDDRPYYEPSLYDDYEDEDEDEDGDEYHKEVIVEGMFGKPSVSTEGNFIVEGMYGRPKYYVDGDIIRENNQFGRPAYRIDGNYIREGMYGRPKYYIDGDLIKENNQFGRVVARRKK